MDQLLPDPTDGLSGYRYLCQEAGHFEQASDLFVMQYLWTWTWRSPNNPEQAGIGFVMRGKTKVETIAEGTGLKYSTVKVCLNRLRQGGWISTEQTTFNGGWRDRLDILVRMDTAGHLDRVKARELADSPQVS